MYIRQLSIDQYETFRRNLDIFEQRKPLDITYHVNLVINGWHYHLHFLIANRRKFVSLQAVKMNKDTHKCELITDILMLGALSELVIAQYSKTDIERI